MGFFGGDSKDYLTESFDDMARDLEKFLARLSKGEAPRKGARSMSRDDQGIAKNEAIVRRRFAELDRGNFGILDDLFAPSYHLHFPGLAKPMSLATTKRFYASLYAAFPDLRHRIIGQTSAGDQVVTRWTATGTHRAEWMGVKATGKRVVFSGINIYTIRRGKFVASHVNWDTLGILQQVGTVRLRLRVPASPSRAKSAR